MCYILAAELTTSIYTCNECKSVMAAGYMFMWYGWNSNDFRNKLLIFLLLEKKNQIKYDI